MSQIEERSINNDFEDVNGNPDGVFNKDGCITQNIPAATTNLVTPHPVNLQEVDIFPGPHSYIHWKPKSLAKVIERNKKNCKDKGQNTESIEQKQPLQNVDDTNQTGVLTPGK